MAGKAKPTVKKLGVKKPTVKKPTTAAKKPGVKKPTAAKKKPATGAKFNINKLIMLIARGAPKKSNKMTGGYDNARINPLTTMIDNFIEASYDRIKTRAGLETTSGGGAATPLNDNIRAFVDTATNAKAPAAAAGATAPVIATYKDAREALIAALAVIPIPDLGPNAALNPVVNAVTLNGASNLVDIAEPLQSLPPTRTNDYDKRVFDVNYMIIVITLCKVHQLFKREIT